MANKTKAVMVAFTKIGKLSGKPEGPVVNAAHVIYIEPLAKGGLGLTRSLITLDTTYRMPGGQRVRDAIAVDGSPEEVGETINSELLVVELGEITTKGGNDS